ncbi:MAG: glutaredoxin family protein [Chloroflexota bacterium]|nr:glutaredoxin family protein [Chloroflexota bacterium]
MVKVYLSRKGISFTERNVSEDREALTTLLEMGYRTTPVTVIGDERIVGYSTSQIDAALAAAGVE